MKRILIVALVVVGLVALGVSGIQADTYSRGNSDHPLRLIAYVLHPLGIAAEYGILRPIHKLVSKDKLDVIFGHEPQIDDVYFVWH